MFNADLETEIHLGMAEEFTPGFRREALTFDERIVGNGGSESFAPADTFLQGLSGGGDRGRGVAMLGCHEF